MKMKTLEWHKEEIKLRSSRNQNFYNSIGSINE